MRTTVIFVRICAAFFILAIASPVFAANQTDPLLETIDLNRPELSAVKNAYEHGDIPAARKLLAAHFRNRTTPKWFFDPSNPPNAATPRDMKIANAAMQHTFTSGGISQTFKNGIDWTFNPTTQPDSPNARDHEWTWGFNRHTYWLCLAKAYNTTGDRKYADELVSEIRDWIAKRPVPREVANVPFSTWRTIEAGLRMGTTWMDVFYRIVRSPDVFPAEALLEMVGSMRDHADYLDAHPSNHGNWKTMELNGEYHVGALFPEFKRAAVWRDHGLNQLRHEIDAQVYPDGLQKELTPNYHGVALHHFVASLNLAELNGLPVPAGYKDGLEKMYDAYMWAASPEGKMTPLNDSGPSECISEMKQGAVLFPNRSDWEWMATAGTSGTAPSHTSHLFPYGGWCVMRSGWEPGARFLLMDAGPFGLGHQHEDKLSIEIHAYGSTLVYDAGTHAYDASAMRQYVLSARGHNVIEFDGLEQNRRSSPETYVVQKPLPIIWKTTKQFDYGAAGYGYEDGEVVGPDRNDNFRQRRHVLFVKPNFWIVLDTLRPRDAGEHVYDSQFHLNAPSATVNASAGTVFTANPDSANILIAACPDSGMNIRTITGQTKPFVQGWSQSTDEGSRYVQPQPCAYFTLHGAGPRNMLYAFVPVPSGKPAPAISIATNADGYTVKYDGHDYQLTLDKKSDKLAVSADGAEWIKDEARN